MFSVTNDYIYSTLNLQLQYCIAIDVKCVCT